MANRWASEPAKKSSRPARWRGLKRLVPVGAISYSSRSITTGTALQLDECWITQVFDLSHEQFFQYFPHRRPFGRVLQKHAANQSVDRRGAHRLLDHQIDRQALLRRVGDLIDRLPFVWSNAAEHFVYQRSQGVDVALEIGVVALLKTLWRSVFR